MNECQIHEINMSTFYISLLGLFN